MDKLKIDFPKSSYFTINDYDNFHKFDENMYISKIKEDSVSLVFDIDKKNKEKINSLSNYLINTYFGKFYYLNTNENDKENYLKLNKRKDILILDFKDNKDKKTLDKLLADPFIYVISKIKDEESKYLINGINKKYKFG